MDTGILINGKPPRDPVFVLTTHTGEVVVQDRFEFG